MPTSLSELISYQPNEKLGLGSNASIPVSNANNLEFTNTILRDIGAREAAKNILKYQQQLQDRDKMLGALSSGTIKVGDTLERDMPVVRDALDKQTEAFKQWQKKGYGDIDGAMSYKKATQAANEAVTQAQARKIFFDKENGTISKEGIPKFAEARKQNLEKNLQNFWGDITPFQETNRLSLEPIDNFAAPITEDFKDPANPLYKGKRTYFSYDNAANKAMEYSLTPEGLNNLNLLHQSLDELSPLELADKVKTINRELGEYNQQRKLKEGDADYAPPVQVVQLPNKKLAIKEPLDKLAAKISLAGKQKYNTETLDVDKGALDLFKAKEDVRAAKAREANDRNKLGLDWSKFNYVKDEDKFGASSVLNEAKDIIDKGVEQTTDYGGKKVKVLRIGDPTLLKNFGNIDKDGNVTNVPDAIEYNRGNDQVKLIYYDDEKTASGKNQITKEVSLDQRTWLKEIAKRSFPNKDIGKVNTLVDDILNKNGNSLYKLTKNGKPLTEAEKFLQNMK
jgi:hypothetical protein